MRKIILILSLCLIALTAGLAILGRNRIINKAAKKEYNNIALIPGEVNKATSSDNTLISNMSGVQASSMSSTNYKITPILDFGLSSTNEKEKLPN